VETRTLPGKGKGIYLRKMVDNRWSTQKASF